MSIREQLFQSLATGPEYRYAFVEEKIRTGLAAQIKTIREQRDGMTQAAFAEKLGKTQSWVSRLEDPNEPIPTVPSLLLIARVFDIGLEVRFVPFADLLDDMTQLSAESLDVPPFDRDLGLFPRKGPQSVGLNLGSLKLRTGTQTGEVRPLYGDTPSGTFRGGSTPGLLGPSGMAACGSTTAPLESLASVPGRAGIAAVKPSIAGTSAEMTIKQQPAA